MQLTAIERDFIPIKSKLSKKLYKLLGDEYGEEATRLCNLMLKEYVKQSKAKIKESKQKMSEFRSALRELDDSLCEECDCEDCKPQL